MADAEVMPSQCARRVSGRDSTIPCRRSGFPSKSSKRCYPFLACSHAASGAALFQIGSPGLDFVRPVYVFRLTGWWRSDSRRE
jgi:hypothetical protein